MTAEEIKDSPAEAKTQMGWLREIAYQLALLNQRPVTQPMSLQPFANAARPQLESPAFVVTTAKKRK